MKFDLKTMQAVAEWFDKVLLDARKYHEDTTPEHRSFYTLRDKIGVKIMQLQQEKLNTPPGSVSLFQVQRGMKLYYKLVQGLKITYLPVTVRGVGPKRIRVFDEGHFRHHRIVKPENLFWHHPEEKQ